MMKCFELVAREHQRNSHYQLWIHENGVIELFTPAFTKQKLEYIHNYILRAGIVEKPEDYLYSSARNCARLWNVLEIGLVGELCKSGDLRTEWRGRKATRSRVELGKLFCEIGSVGFKWESA